MIRARGLPSLKSGLPYLACLALMPWLAAALAPFLEVHLGNGKMFFREKKAKQQFPNLMGENRVIQYMPLSFPAFISCVMLFAAILLWKRKHVGCFPPCRCIWSQWQSQGIPPLGARRAQPAPSLQRAGARGASLAPLPGCGAWPSPVFVLVTSLLAGPGARVHSSHIPHCGMTDLAGVCLFTSHIPQGPCSPRTGCGEAVRVGERKCCLVSWNSFKDTFFFESYAGLF